MRYKELEGGIVKRACHSIWYFLGHSGYLFLATPQIITPALAPNTILNLVNPTKNKAVKGFGALFEFTDEKTRVGG
jgi:hypothetical protein